MKRALKKRVKAVLKNTPSSDGVPAVEQLNVVNPKIKRQVRTKAAMIGLAISMGATSMLVTRQSDQAQAAAPVGSQKAASAIPAAPDTEVKFAAAKLLETQPVSLASVQDNPVILEPTAISQVPGLEAKLQVGVTGQSVQVPTPEAASKATATYKTSLYLHSQAAQGLQAASQPGEAQKLSSASGILGTPAISLTAKPQTLTTDGETANSEANAQLKAQQEFALNRLQEKSHRLRNSLAELRSEETKNLSAATIALAQPTNKVKTAPQINETSTATEQLPNLPDANNTSLVSRLKQGRVTNVPSATPAPATLRVAALPDPIAYEVKPGDTLAAIASNYGTSVSELVRANNLTNPNQIQISQKLMIPAPGVNRSIANQSQLATNPNIGQPSITPKLVTSPVNTASTNSNLPITSQLSVIADNSIALPTPATANDQIPTANSLSPLNGVGGNTPVPKVFSEIQSNKRPERVARTKGNERLRSLQAEIERLREKYRAQQAGVVVPASPENNNAPVSLPVPRPNNTAVSYPNFQRNAVQIPVPSPIGTFRGTPSPREPINPEFLPNQVPNPSRARLATPPTRMRGNTVSPQLPPLAAVDQYLPKPIDETLPPPSSSSVAYQWPAKGVLTSGFGTRWGRPHKGIDIANAVGTPIYASADGVIAKAGWNKGGYGILVEVRHPDGSMTRYAHNSKLLVRAGQEVRQGETIALMGSTGFSTGPHTHFEIHPPGKGAVNPVALLASNRI
ncbi:MAG: peptidoglycan DD-metalloendopeptidase family protein [Goleter apudmare HA4340-LM2]|nr:peptidoglycan DD-metalloendopeptidase family protein [Goleter apudmare HA4340-LM2]